MLLQTNIVVCVIITAGFIITSLIGYQSNTSFYEKDVEHVSTLVAEGIYNQIDKILSEPVNVSLTMANDSLLKSFLSDEAQHIDDDTYTKKLQIYLDTYRQKYSYDSVFLVSVATNRYYHFNGIDRILTPENSENVWYYDFLKNSDEHSLNIDNDEAANNHITVFVNCKIRDENGATMGIIGVGLTVDSLQALLKEYDEEFGVTARLVDNQGVLQLSSEKNSYEHISLADDFDLAGFNTSIFEQKTDKQTFWYTSPNSKCYIVSQYVENLKWHLIVAKDMTAMNRQLRMLLFRSFAIIGLIIVLVLFIITIVLKKYREQIVSLSVSQKQEYQKLLNQSTAELYENIFEIDITHNRASGDDAHQYFKGLGMSLDTPFDEALKTIAQKQIKAEYAQIYLDTFLTSRVIESYKSGINNLSCDFPITENGGDYHWVRIICRIFYWPSDESIRMISYRKNIDEEKNREMQLLEKSQKDSMTGLYNKGFTEKIIEGLLCSKESMDSKHALLMIDIDDFKNVNDTYGHAFGDTVITAFAAELKRQFHDSDVIGRTGGDEFTVFVIDCNDIDLFRKKLERFCQRIAQKDFGQQKGSIISCSIGAALSPEHGTNFAQVYERADQALYYAKAHGKCSFHIMGDNPYNSASLHVDSRDFKEMLDKTTDGIAKFAVAESLKLLYFNQKLLELVGSSSQILSDPSFDPLAYVHPDDLPHLLDVIHEAVLQKKSITVICRLQHKDKHYFLVKLHVFFVKELYEGKYPVFYTLYNNLTGFIQQNE